MTINDAIDPWLAHTRVLVPGLEFFDAHTHIGQNDPDGFKQTPEELLAALRAGGAIGCFVFAMHEPDGYPQANDYVIDVALAHNAAREPGPKTAGDSGTRSPDPELVPFCRVDPNAEDPVAEAERSLARGARGIKLHPRAEQFQLDHPQVARLFALAHERRLPVLIHAGRGIPALGKHVVAHTRRYPEARAILAHAAVSDLAWIWQDAAELPNLLFDSSWWVPADLVALYTLMPPGQVLFASDVPYGNPAIAAATHVRYTLQAGYSSEQVQLVTSRQSLNIASAADLTDAGPALGDNAPRTSHILLDRAAALLQTAALMLFRRAEGALEVLSLARLAMDAPDDIDDAAVFATLRRLMAQYEQAAAEQPEERAPLSLLTLAAAVARTPDVPVPAL
jgi:uncharacterized protein